MIGGRGLTKGGPDGRYRRARPEGRGDPEDAGRVLRQGPSQSVAGGPRGHCGRLGPQSETATRRAGRVDPWLVRRVASLRGWTRTRVRVTSGRRGGGEPAVSPGSDAVGREGGRRWVRMDFLEQVERVRRAREVRRPWAMCKSTPGADGVGLARQHAQGEGKRALLPAVLNRPAFTVLARHVRGALAGGAVVHRGDRPDVVGLSKPGQRPRPRLTTPRCWRSSAGCTPDPRSPTSPREPTCARWAAGYGPVSASASSTRRLRVEVSDDGVGGVPAHGALTALRDRVESVGGTVTISSPAGAGTTITAVL